MAKSAIPRTSTRALSKRNDFVRIIVIGRPANEMKSRQQERLHQCMSHVGTIFKKTDVINIAMIVSKKNISLVNLYSDWFSILTIINLTQSSKKPSRICPLKQGRGVDGPPNLKLPKWLSCFDFGTIILDRLRLRSAWFI